MEELLFSTKKKEELINITREIEQAVRIYDIKDGICVLFVPHATAALFINENEPGLKEDLLNSLSLIVPNREGYKHDRLDKNATSHIKATLVSPSLTLTIHEGSLVLGTWQQILLCEFDGPRDRKVLLQVVGQ